MLKERGFNMRWIDTKQPFNLLFLLGIFLFIVIIFDILLGYEWMIILLALFIILIVLTVLLIIRNYQKQFTETYSIEEFEKRLKGGLYHYKCQVCDGIFAVKKSKGNNKKIIKMTCPDCGAIGYVPSKPDKIKAEVPEKKSIKANFKCDNCGEVLTIWAEGTDLYKNVSVYCCPFCGTQRTLNRF